MEESVETKRRSIKLLCPSLSSNTIQIAACDDEKLDIGSIARVFGLDPNTVTLNGHFISRGSDFIASSVTWRSLIGFFSARGLSTGVADSGALVVHGKLNRIGVKRLHNPVGDEIPGTTSAQGFIRDNKKPHCGLLNTGNCVAGSTFNGPDGFNLKRKLCLEDSATEKRSRYDECSPSHDERNRGSSTISRLSCGFMGTNMKRMRDEERVAATPLKKTR